MHLLLIIIFVCDQSICLVTVSNGFLRVLISGDALFQGIIVEHPTGSQRLLKCFHLFTSGIQSILECFGHCVSNSVSHRVFGSLYIS